MKQMIKTTAIVAISSLSMLSFGASIVSADEVSINRTLAQKISVIKNMQRVLWYR